MKKEVVKVEEDTKTQNNATTDLQNKERTQAYNAVIETVKKRNEQKGSLQFLSLLSCYMDFCEADKRNDQLLMNELSQLKQLIDKMRFSNDDDEFVYKEIKEILHYISTSSYKEQKLVQRMYDQQQKKVIPTPPPLKK